MAGITMWNYFSSCLTTTSNVFVANAGIFGKVYFPRLIMPLSIVMSNMVKLGIQMLLFLGVWTFFFVFKDANLQPNLYILLVPFIIIVSAFLALGFGMIFSAMTTKYRDLTQLLSFGIQLAMYGTPVIYPMSNIPPRFAILVKINPVSSLVETFRYAFTGSGMVSWWQLGYSLLFTIVIVFLGTIIFTKVEKNFMDTV
jgi:lipopolysaccharide transport system permease protein